MSISKQLEQLAIVGTLGVRSPEPKAVVSGLVEHSLINPIRGDNGKIETTK